MEYNQAPPKLLRLLKMSSTYQGEAEVFTDENKGFVASLGEKTLYIISDFSKIVKFIGEIIISVSSSVHKKVQFRKKDFWNILQHSSIKALMIIFLISFLIGIILGYVGSVQLHEFGAGIYLANLVGLAMFREMGPMMTAVVMSGRTGAAFAAELGTMNLNKEIDALKVLGISPNNFLVLPRIIALATSIPMLTVYADVIGTFSGALTGYFVLKIPFLQYWSQLLLVMTVNDFLVGFIKSIFFGMAIAVISCYRGIYCEQRAESVGLSATKAVVNSIVSIIVIDTIFTIVFDILGM